MKSNSSHLVFYDGSCGLCDRIVAFLIKRDKKKCFVFAPLDGITAGKFLQDLAEKYKQGDSLILVENYQSVSFKIYLFSQAAFRIAWLLGGFWKLIGWLFFLPAFLFNWIYYFIARHRHQFFSSRSCEFPQNLSKDRFLP